MYDPTIGAPASSVLLDGDATWNQAYSVAQYNFFHVGMPGGQIKVLPFPYLVCNAADDEGEFLVEAWQAPLNQIANFLPGKGGRAVIERPGKINHLGIVASAKAGAEELGKAPARLPSVKVPRRSTRPFTLGISLEKGNALIHVTQWRNRRLVGGLSVLATADEG